MFAQTIGKYRVTRTIGSGSYGTVLEATDLVLNRTVALKVLRSPSGGGADTDTHLREARALARLRHPNIVTIFDLGQEKDQTFLAMEHIEGESLALRLRRGALPVPVVVGMARQLADALCLAHQTGVVHADIKPGNVILDRQSRPLLVDFGLARLSRAADTQRTVATVADMNDSMGRGTFFYMAPELFMGAPPDNRSDIFAFGAMLFEMLSGRRAFAADSDGAVMQRVINGRPDPLTDHCPDLPAALDDLIARMLSPDPARRPPSMAAVRDGLDALLAPDVVLSPVPVGARLRLRGQAWLRRALRDWRRPLMVAGVAGLLLAGGLLAGHAGLLTDMPRPSLQSLLSQSIDRLYHFDQRGAIDAAVDGFQRVLARDPQNAAATAGLSLALFRRFITQQPDPVIRKQADAAARLAFSLDSHLALARIAMGWAESYANNWPAAYQHFDMAQTLDKDNLLTLEGLGRLHRRDGRLDDAMAIYQRGIAVAPDYRLFHDELGRIYFNRADYVQAEASFRRSIALAPDSPFAYASLSAVQHMQGRTSDAIATVQQGLRIRPHSMLYNNLGSYLYFLGQYPQAAEAFESLSRLEGQGQYFLTWGNLGDAYRWVPGKEADARKAYQLALHHLAKELESRPQDPVRNAKAALYHAKLGDGDKADAALALALADPTPAILFDAAVANEILGRRDEALSLLTRARKAGYALEEINQEPELARLRMDRRYQQSLIEG